MRISQIRNATLIVEYAGKKFLVDPMLADKGAFPAFTGTANETRNPIVALPVAAEKVVDVDCVIVTHTHRDHWDEAAAALLAKRMPIYVQHPKDADKLASDGFLDLRLLTPNSRFEDVSLSKTQGQHGTDAAIAAAGKRLGEVCGVVFKHSSEKTLYVAGDTVWNKYVAEVLKQQCPDIIVLNCGDAQIAGLGSIIMGTSGVGEVAKEAPSAIILATHMEAVNHCMLTRRELRAYAAANGFADRLCVPSDGESVIF